MKFEKKHRVILADDCKIICQGLRMILEKAGIDVLGDAGNAADALRLAGELSPDLMLVSVTLPESIELTRRVAETCPNTSVIILSKGEEGVSVSEALLAGAKGFLLKDSTSQDLLTAITNIATGGVYLSPQVAGLLLREQSQNAPGETLSFHELSPREKEVLQLIADGKNTKEIAFAEGVSIKTIETCRKSLMKKLNLNTIADLIKYAIREGVASIRE